MRERSGRKRKQEHRKGLVLANIYLHYVLDLWVHQWRKRHARGRVIIVRYADDFVLGFQYESDALRMLEALKERLAKFSLEINEEKTRLIEFGKFVSERRERRGEKRCETFAFLGFTHYCGRSRTGKFVVKRRTQAKRMRRRLTRLREEAKRRMHAPVAEQWKWLVSVLRGHYAYYGLPSNYRSMKAFHYELKRIWFHTLRRRSRRSNMTWPRFNLLLERYPLPTPKITHTRTALKCGNL